MTTLEFIDMSPFSYFINPFLFYSFCSPPINEWCSISLPLILAFTCEDIFNNKNYDLPITKTNIYLPDLSIDFFPPLLIITTLSNKFQRCWTTRNIKTGHTRSKPKRTVCTIRKELNWRGLDKNNIFLKTCNNTLLYIHQQEQQPN